MKHYARQINRFRWLRKTRTVSRGEGNASRTQALRYILTDPELDTFSYEVANSAELAEHVTGITGLTSSQVLDLFDEARHDAVLASRIRRGSRWDLSVKRQPEIGRHLVTYAIVRAIHPPTVLEVGVRFGLGSLVILRALERNRAEGTQGELVSVDIDPFAASLVPRDTPGWQFTVGPSPDALADAVAGRRIGLLIADSIQDPRATTAEVRTALTSAAYPLVVMQSGWNMVVPNLCDAAGLDWVRLVEQPIAHVGAGRQAFLARFDNDDDVARALRVLAGPPAGGRDADHRPPL